ncbi:MAG: ATP-dependent Clp protease ATP-binding subunit ClpX, partial [Clostridia bacterium]|nr:ATP-dependent Clp protease ATP-binding subunit ClpX [Clostridia bacterium]
MAQNTNNGSGVRVNRSCAFCGRGEEQVDFLIPSPTGIYICDKCVDACNDIITDYFTDEDPAEALADAELPTPVEIKATLDEYIIGQ